YRASWPGMPSKESDPVELVLTGVGPGDSSISLSPEECVEIGTNVTIQCWNKDYGATFLLHKDGCSAPIQRQHLHVVGTATFTIFGVTPADSGTYKPLGEGTGDSRWHWALPTGPCPIAVRSPRADHSFPPPNISLHPKECVEIGTNVTIQCWNKDYGATFLLHKDGRSALVQRQGSDGAGTASFTFSGVTLADSGTYRCSFRPWHSPFVSSPLGDSVTLEVTPTPAPPGRYQPPIWVPPVSLMGGSVITSLPHGGVAGDEDTQIPAPHRC
uniref:Ig-like domain-containing protein n=1 Tax=Meleagris gallopavo TaxID=9103 RepID=A0A803YBP6_MELGA